MGRRGARGGGRGGGATGSLSDRQLSRGCLVSLFPLSAGIREVVFLLYWGLAATAFEVGFAGVVV